METARASVNILTPELARFSTRGSFSGGLVSCQQHITLASLLLACKEMGIRRKLGVNGSECLSSGDTVVQ